MARAINLYGSPKTMPTLIGDCPRCKAKHITFDIAGKNLIPQRFGTSDWQVNFELFCRCRHCLHTTIFVVHAINYEISSSSRQSDYWDGKNINADFEIDTYISLKDFAGLLPPDSLPDDVDKAFREGAACLAIAAYNAAGSMFRLAIDLSTKGYLPGPDVAEGPTRRQRRELAARLEWLFEKALLPLDLQDLASSVREDGNDAVHDGSLGKEDAEDLADFATALLTRIYTEPARVEAARQRRADRRQLG